jgi:hypothetical protein
MIFKDPPRIFIVMAGLFLSLSFLLTYKRGKTGMAAIDMMENIFTYV